jgi:hypothetical protein
VLVRCQTATLSGVGWFTVTKNEATTPERNSSGLEFSEKQVLDGFVVVTDGRNEVKTEKRRLGLVR